jgi:hypothetical protein
MQKFSTKISGRMTAIESRKNILDGKMSSVLATVDANTTTLLKLKSMLAKFMENPKAVDNGSLSESKSAIDHWSGAEVHIEGNEAAKASSIPNAGTVVNHTKGVSLDNSDIFKDGFQAADVSTGNTCKMPTRNEKSPTREKEVTTAAETLELVDSFLELETADGNSANENLVVAEALADISSPRPEDKAIDPTGDLNVASEIKETQKQGCHKGRFWRKITVRTSDRVRVYPTDAVLPVDVVLPVDGFLPSANAVKTASARTHLCPHGRSLASTWTWTSVRTHLRPLPSPSPSPLPSAVRADAKKRKKKKKLFLKK